MLEKQLQNKCIKWLKANDIFYHKFQDKFSAGFPDLMIARDGRVLFIELKQKGKKPTPLQAAYHEKMRKQGGLIVEVIDDFEKFKNTVKLWIAAGTKEAALWN